MIKILQEGTKKTFGATCSECGAVFTYDQDDIQRAMRASRRGRRCTTATSTGVR